MGKAINELFLNGFAVHSFSRLNTENIPSFSQTVQQSAGVVDFSNTDNILPAIEICIQHKKPYLCGTTGLYEAHFEALQKASKTIPVLYTANTSLGIAILKKALAMVAKAIGNEADIEIVETHHRFKKDAPSGTALALGKIISKSLGQNPKVGYSSLRGGNVAGKHVVNFFYGDETITLTHDCLNRDVFAQGAYKAGLWLFKQPPGYYTLEDMLDLK